MRIPLAPEPSMIPVQPATAVTGNATREASESWRTWVAVNAPREPPPEPVETIRLLNNLKPYVPRWEP